MNCQETAAVSAFYLTRWFALMPLGIFMVLTVVLGLQGVSDTEGMVAMG